MPVVIYYVALPFRYLEDGQIAAGEPQECRDSFKARSIASNMASDPDNCGAIAFSRTGDPAIEGRTVCPLDREVARPTLRVRGLLGLAEPILIAGGRAMGNYSEAFIGIDVAKVRNAIAIADAGRQGEVRSFGEVDASEANMRRVGFDRRP